MVKKVWQYSQNWTEEKNSPRRMVISSLIFLWVRAPPIRLKWVQVTVIPEEIRIKVFKRGTLNGSKGLTPLGGHMIPSSTAGLRAGVKEGSKKKKKKHDF